jgi:hypothetical protein
LRLGKKREKKKEKRKRKRNDRSNASSPGIEDKGKHKYRNPLDKKPRIRPLPAVISSFSLF